MVGAWLFLQAVVFVMPFCSCFNLRHPSLFSKQRQKLSREDQSQSFQQRRHARMYSFNNVAVHDRTHKSLDFQDLCGELKKLCKTVLGTSLCFESASKDLANVKNSYAMVHEIDMHLEHIPLFSRMDVWKVVATINNNTAQPERVELAEFSDALKEVLAIHAYLSANNASLPLFQVLTSPLSLPKNVTDTFNTSFRTDSHLNLDKYSLLRQLHAEKEQQRASVIETLKGLLQSSNIRDKLADTEFVEINGRYCIALKSTHRRGAGIVHGTSNTALGVLTCHILGALMSNGKTLYVEPVSIIEPTNELKRLESRYQQEEQRILLTMCQCIAAHLAEIVAAVCAVAQIDVIAAKARLGRRLEGVIPEVSDEGCIRCVNARHPLLVLRKRKDHDIKSLPDNTIHDDSPALKIVGNSFELNATKPALVISGPNAGGKTVVLKTAGLFALMVQHGIPLPAEPGARVDYFPAVVADIGDLQTVSGDISTFSGHLLVCREILRAASHFTSVEGEDQIDKRKKESEIQGRNRVASSGGQCLVLLDEVGTGTDPEQGSALAQSLLECLVSMGARVLATTHYQRIKELAVQDARFQVAAMEFDRNIPTYRMRIGSMGESYALEAARRLGLPEEVLTRADALLDDSARSLAGLQRRLLEETDAARALQKEYHRQQAQVATREKELESTQVQLQERIEALRQGKTEEHLRDIKGKERELASLMDQARETIAKQLREAATSNKKSASWASISTADTHIAALQVSLKTSRVHVEKKVIATRASAQQAAPLVDGQTVEVGARLIVLDPNHLSFGTEVFVTSANKGKGRVCVRLAGNEIKMERHLLGVPVESTLVGKIDADETQMTPKERRLHRDLLQVTNFNDADLEEVARQDGNKNNKHTVVPRTVENTLDVRAAPSYTEVQELVRTFVRHQSSKDKKITKKSNSSAGGTMDWRVCYVLHGVNCVYKDRLRVWLASVENVQQVSPALLSAGGDAVTMLYVSE